MITELRVENYGCIKSARAPLTRVHAFAGQGDSGKSTLLRALRVIVQFACGVFVRQDGKLRPFDPWLSRGTKEARVYLSASVPKGGPYALIDRGKGIHERVGTDPPGEIPRVWDQPTWFREGVSAGDAHHVLAQLQGARYVRLSPEALRRSSPLFPGESKLDFLDEHGLGLSGVYDALRDRRGDAFTQIVTQVRALFPTLQGFRVPAITDSNKALEGVLASGVSVPLERLSDGLLCYLALAVLPYLEPASVVLVDSPEEGLSPRSIPGIVRMLRELARRQGTQVILATRSPLVLNELTADEITIVTRSEQGTELTPIKQLQGFAGWNNPRALGDLWLTTAGEAG